MFFYLFYRCILRMDHHCFWVGNCVGLLNQKYFILFLFYASFCLSIIVVTILWNWAFDDFSIREIVGKTNSLFVTINCASSFAITLAVGYLFAFQIWCIKKNITTIEFHLESMKGPVFIQMPLKTFVLFSFLLILVEPIYKKKL